MAHLMALAKLNHQDVERVTSDLPEGISVAPCDMLGMQVGGCKHSCTVH
jgi:hypothetical protein